MRRSKRVDWENFWREKSNAEDVYSNADRVLRNLLAVTDLEGKRVLEVGAGTGRDSFNLIPYGAEIYLLDYAESSLKIIRKLALDNKYEVNIISGNALKLPFKDESFDIVFHQGLLEHFRKPEADKLVDENIRVLKRGGFLLIDVPQRYHIYTVLKHILIAVGRWFAGWERSFSIRELERLIESRGLEIVHTYGEWMYPSLFYRVLREILKKAGIKLPLYPVIFKPVSNLRARVREKLSRFRVAFYTFISIGVVARKI
jgi:ubiquinone/menaquinone biosynthesis C-methylase UbiE